MQRRFVSFIFNLIIFQTPQNNPRQTSEYSSQFNNFRNPSASPNNQFHNVSREFRNSPQNQNSNSNYQPNESYNQNFQQTRNYYQTTTSPSINNKSYVWDKRRGPYGVSFEEMANYRKDGQIKYRDDLEYLMSLKNGRHGDMTQSEWEAYNRKLHYMNDRYAYGELDKVNFLRGMMRGYEDDINARRNMMKAQKMRENEEDLKRLVDVKALEREEYERAQNKKRLLYAEQMKNLDDFNRRKQMEKNQKVQEGKNTVNNLFPQEMSVWEKPIKAYKKNIEDKNNRIFDNLQNYNNQMGTLDPNVFNAKNDLEFNKMIADQRAKQKYNDLHNPKGLNERLKEKQELDKSIRQEHEADANRKKIYKEYLDNQNALDKLNKLKNKADDDGQQLLMPAYYYPNLPEPVYHKARDSLLASKNQEEYFGKDMNKFFRGDADNNTLIDYEGKSRYLGDSRLRHNPITCPVNDYYYNKYVNKLKKNSEYIPPEYETNQNNQNYQVNNNYNERYDNQQRYPQPGNRNNMSQYGERIMN